MLSFNPVVIGSWLTNLFTHHFSHLQQQHSTELSLVKMSKSQYIAHLLNVVRVTWSGNLNKECSNEVMNIK